MFGTGYGQATELRTRVPANLAVRGTVAQIHLVGAVRAGVVIRWAILDPFKFISIMSEVDFDIGFKSSVFVSYFECCYFSSVI